DIQLEDRRPPVLDREQYPLVDPRIASAVRAREPDLISVRRPRLPDAGDESAARVGHGDRPERVRYQVVERNRVRAPDDRGADDLVRRRCKLRLTLPDVRFGDAGA